MRRFWKEVAARPTDQGWTIELDERPVKTPARAPLVAPTATLADAIANEWRRVAETVDPRAMPLTGLANAAIDRVASGLHAFAASLARYADADLLCYRAEGPQALVDRQEKSWDPLLAWARRRYDVDFAITVGIVHVPQPEAMVAQLGHAVASLNPWRMAGVSPLVTIGGSLVAALAVAEKAVTADSAWDAVSIDDRWQLDHWGADTEAVSALEGRRRDFLTAASFLEMVD